VLKKAIYSEQFLVSYNAKKVGNPRKCTVMVVRQPRHIEEEFAQRNEDLSIEF
jgi:hypothetical protein